MLRMHPTSNLDYYSYQLNRNKSKMKQTWKSRISSILCCTCLCRRCYVPRSFEHLQHQAQRQHLREIKFMFIIMHVSSVLFCLVLTSGYEVWLAWWHMHVCFLLKDDEEIEIEEEEEEEEVIAASLFLPPIVCLIVRSLLIGSSVHSFIPKFIPKFIARFWKFMTFSFQNSFQNSLHVSETHDPFHLSFHFVTKKIHAVIVRASQSDTYVRT